MVIRTWSLKVILTFKNMIDATKKNLPRSDELLDFFEAPQHAYFPQMITGVLFDVLAKLPPGPITPPFMLLPQPC